MSAPFIVAVFLSQALRTSNTPTEIRQCRPGFFHNVTIDRCQVCPNGTYTNNHNLESSCHGCSTCTVLQTLVAACTSSNDAVCRCRDEYNQHEDGCSLKAGAYAEARLPDTPEWTWSQYLLVILSVAVVVLIGFAIYVIVRCPEIRTKLLCCLRNNISVNDQPSIQQLRAVLLDLKTKVSSMDRVYQEKLDSEAPNQLTIPVGSERPHQPPNGCSAVPVASAANVPNNTAQPPGNGGLAAASASTIAHHPISLSSIATGGASDAGTHGGTAVASAQPEVHLESNTASTPKNDHRLSRIGNVEDSHELVVIPPKAGSGGLETPDGNKGAGNSQQCVMGSSHQDGCTRCSETNGLSTAGTLGCAEECQKSSTVVTVDDSASREDANERRPLLQQ